MSRNFDLSKIDDDDYLANLENDEDYSNRQVYDRSYSPPSPSVLESLAFQFDDTDSENDELDEVQLKVKANYEPPIRVQDQNNRSS